MANTTADKTPISLDNLARNNERMKEYIQSEIDKIPSSTVDDALSDTSENPVQNKVINSALTNKADSLHTHTKAEITDFPTSLPASDVKAWAKADTKPTYTASEVGADASGSANTALTNAKSYTDTKIADLINGAPTTLDTLGEIATAMEENQSVVEALNTAIGTKANASDLTAHTGNKSNPHGVTKSQVGLGNVPNVATNDQTPSYTEATSLTKLTSGEKISVAFGKISKAITDLISHIGDSVKHITSTERTNWNSAKTHADSTHAPSNAQANVIETVKVNGTALSPSSKAVDITIPTVGNGTITVKQAGTTKGTFTTNQSGNTTIELTDNNTTYGVATSSALGLVKSGTDITVDSSGNVSVNDDSHNHVISNVDGLQSALDGKASSSHTHSSYVNQNAFSNVVVGSTTVAADSTTDTLTLVAGSNVTITPDATNDKITISATDTNTHYTSKNVVGSSTAISNTTSALTNGNVYLNSVENGAVTSAHKISGSGATTVTTDASGNIIINSTNTDTKVTNTLNTTTKAYITGTTSSSTNTGTQIFDTGVYLDTTAGMLTATTFKGALSGNATTSNKLASTSYTTITINSSSWTTNSGGGYMYTYTLPTSMPYRNFNFDVVLSTDQSAAKLQIKAWNCIIADGNITQTISNGVTTAFTFYAFTTKPSVALTIGIQGVS